MLADKNPTLNQQGQLNVLTGFSPRQEQAFGSIALVLAWSFLLVNLCKTSEDLFLLLKGTWLFPVALLGPAASPS